MYAVIPNPPVDRLKYIAKILRAGWENRVAEKAINWMRNNLERRQAASMGYQMERGRA